VLLRTLSQLRAADGVRDVKLDQIRGKTPMQFTFDFRYGEGGPVKIEDRQRFLIILTLAVIAVFAADRLVFGPLTKLWSVRSERVAELRQGSHGRHPAVAAGKEFARGVWSDMRATRCRTTRRWPSSSLLKAFDTWSQESRVSITGITPQWKHDADDYMTIECRVGRLW